MTPSAFSFGTLRHFLPITMVSSASQSSWSEWLGRGILPLCGTSVLSKRQNTTG